MNSFQDLEAWKKAKQFRNEVSLVAQCFPSEEKYRLVDQMIRSSRSVMQKVLEDIIIRKIYNFAGLQEVR